MWSESSNYSAFFFFFWQKLEISLLSKSKTSYWIFADRHLFYSVCDGYSLKAETQTFILQRNVSTKSQY